MGQKTKKATRGAAVEYYSRKQAMRHLQINLPSFIRLCSWKGIYPSEPHSRKTVGRGSTTPKVYYKRKDVNLLLSEPILAKLRELRIHNLKMRRAREKKDKDKQYRLMKCKPRYTLHHLVQERYPTIEEVLAHGMNDALKSVMTFSTLPKMVQFNSGLIVRSRRLRLEWLNYVVSQQAVRKAFINVRGLWLEAEVRGVAALWAQPHEHTATVLPGNADYRLLATKVEFDSCLLACLMKNLYAEAGLIYPPVFGADCEDERGMLASLAGTVQRGVDRDAEERLARLAAIDESAEDALRKQEAVSKVQALLAGKRVFLAREVPREVLVVLVRSCGGEVSWDAAVCAGAPFPEATDDIAYQVVDRPLAPEHMRVDRFYVQPQFLFDSLNAGRLLPVKDYMPGLELPAHVSPFVDAAAGGYVPPEWRYLRGEVSKEALYEDEEGAEEEEAPEEIIHEEEDESEDDEEEDDEDIEEMDVEEAEAAPAATKTRATRISKHELQAKIAANKEIRLKEMELPKKRRNLYNKMKHAEKDKVKQVTKLQEKRKAANKKRANK